MELLKYIDITIIIILIIIFFTYFFYHLLFNTNKIIRYRVINEPPEEEDYKIMTNIKKTDTCRSICKGKTCCQYEKKKRDYNKCNICKMKLMCYNEDNESCEPCLFGRDCSKYSCNNNEPINPKDNYCTLC